MSDPEGPFRPQEWIDRLPAFLGPLKTRAKRYATPEASQVGNVVTLAPHRRYGCQSCLFYLHAPAEEVWIESYTKRCGSPIPAFYADFLRASNGLDFLDLRLFGLPPSKQGSPALLDRTQIQPLDVESANLHWKRSFWFTGNLFHFGVRPHRDASAGYFWHPAKGLIQSRSKFGRTLGAWRSFEEFLESELSASEERFRALEAAGLRPSPKLPGA